MRELIYSVVEAFYQKATNDVLIGYHFVKFNEPQVLEDHLQRITSFWEMQLTGTTSVPLEGPFHLLGRWIMLFHQTLDSLESEVDHPNIKTMNELWKQRIGLFEERFKSHPQMFK